MRLDFRSEKYFAWSRRLKHSAKRWDLAPSAPSAYRCALSQLSPIIVQLLYNRGLRDPSEAALFLNGRHSHPDDPSLIAGMSEAIDRILIARQRNEVVAIYGDFDADGVTAAALLTEVLTAVGMRIIPYIPNRMTEGYGLNCAAIQGLAEQGVQLIITTDCGIGNAGEIEYAATLGLDIIITDHHEVLGSLPKAAAIVNPRRSTCPYPFKQLAAVGVAFKLAQALFQQAPSGDGRSSAEVEQDLLDLVALGTVTDLAPLLGENHTLVRQGLAKINEAKRPGVAAMLNQAGISPGRVTSSTISYILGPRLNSAGRLHDATISYQLLVTRSKSQAEQLAIYLERANQERQRLMEESLNRAREEIITQGQPTNLLIISGTEYPAGIVGLVAGKLMEEFYRPALVVEIGNEHSKGSARSIAEFNITEALDACQDLLSRYGGHAQAAGFTISNVNFEAFKERLYQIAEDKLKEVDLQPRITIDCEVALPELTWNLYKEISKMSPFGYGNPAPCFLTRGVRVVESRVLRPEYPGHLKLKLHDGYRYWNGVSFGMGELADRLPGIIDIVYSLQGNERNGLTALELNIKGICPHEASGSVKINPSGK
ncbi:MAG: single-stranded-DNA-specific exonuclease RecJ [Chloroflexi bacterium]|nr:single-stranded-DNA-specific exonuclease RecJ [Chloroflexota bacterium]MCL5075579.1 single-stranded-DNA-specific exonuclease RecJ [Chloroflexota bacterium]